MQINILSEKWILIKREHVSEWLMTSTVHQNRSQVNREVKISSFFKLDVEIDNKINDTESNEQRSTFNLVHLHAVISKTMTCFYDCHLRSENRERQKSASHKTVVNKLLSSFNLIFFSSNEILH